MNRIRSLATAAAVSVLGLGQAAAQTPSQTPVELMPSHLVRRIQEDSFVKVTNRLVGQGVISGAKAWPAGQPIRVCFFGGSASLRRQIASTALAWIDTGAPISLDFGDLDNPRLCGAGFAHIRVGFDQPGYWSFVGQDSIVYAAQSEQSLNLARFNIAPPETAEFKRVVLHEFGHALGFQHEHQHPTNVCEAEYNWPAIYRYLGGPPNSWDPETVDHNMRARPYHHGDVATDFDPQSIMLYSFPATFYLNGERSDCFARGNSDLSEGDKKTLRSAYTTGGAFTQATALAAIAGAANNLSVADRQIVSDRLLFLSAPNDTKAAIVGQWEAQVRSPNFGAALQALGADSRANRP